MLSWLWRPEAPLEVVRRNQGGCWRACRREAWVRHPGFADATCYMVCSRGVRHLVAPLEIVPGELVRHPGWADASFYVAPFVVPPLEGVTGGAS